MFSLLDGKFLLQGVTNPLGRPVCCFDPDGLIFAAGVESKSIKLYDIRAYDKVTYKQMCLWWFALSLFMLTAHLIPLYKGPLRLLRNTV